MRYRVLAALVTTTSLLIPVCGAAASPATARVMYTRALEQERVVRDDANKPTLADMRKVVAAYEAVVRAHPVSGYCDNALWQGGNLAMLAYERFGEEADRKTATRLFNQLVKGYPSSKLAKSARELLATPAAVATASPVLTPTPELESRPLAAPAVAAPSPTAPAPVENPKTRSEPRPGGLIGLRDVH